MAARADHLPWTARVRRALPEGSTLPDRNWQRRHRAMLTLLWLHVVGLTLFALAQGFPVFHSLGEGGVVASKRAERCLTYLVGGYYGQN